MLSPYWECTSCQIRNKFARETCQGCYRARPKPYKSLKYLKQSRSLLLSGYIKEHDDNLNIHTDVENLILLYYNDIIEWVIKPNKLQNNNNKLTGPIINYHNLQFQLNFEKDNEGNALFYINLLPNLNIASVQVSVFMWCDETETDFKTLNEYKSWTAHSLYGLTTKWLPHSLLYDTCKKYKQLTLLAYIDIISYQMTSKSMNILKHIKINRINTPISFVWHIDETLYKKFKSCHNGESFWCDEYFGTDNNFCFWCAPKGINPQTDGKFLIYVGLLALPHNMRQLYIRYAFEIVGGYMDYEINNSDDEYEDYTFKFTARYASKGYLNSAQPYLSWTTNALKLGSLPELKTISLNVQLNIINTNS